MARHIDGTGLVESIVEFEDLPLNDLMSDVFGAFPGFLQPAFFSEAICRSSFWSLVETRAYPIFIPQAYHDLPLTRNALAEQENPHGYWVTPRVP